MTRARMWSTRDVVLLVLGLGLAVFLYGREWLFWVRAGLENRLVRFVMQLGLGGALTWAIHEGWLRFWAHGSAAYVLLYATSFVSCVALGTGFPLVFALLPPTIFGVIRWVISRCCCVQRLPRESSDAGDDDEEDSE